jgi:ligand-binding sensor domain-containing protein/signal transduction histidine kinase
MRVETQLAFLAGNLYLFLTEDRTPLIAAIIAFVNTRTIRKISTLVIGLVTVALTSPTSTASEYPTQFLHLGVDDGLSQNSVYCILQDRKGFMWFGTGDGLNRYDGYAFVHLRSRPSDTTTLADNTIRSLYEDIAGVLWVGTDKALHRFDRRNESFTRFMLHLPGSAQSAPISVSSMLEDQDGRFWIGSATGLFLFDRLLGRFDTIPGWIYGPNLSNNILTLHKDDPRTLWIGTRKGPRVLEMRNEGFVEVPIPFYAQALANAQVSSMLKGKNGITWFCTREQGIMSVDPSRKVVKWFRVALGQPNTIAEDANGAVWAGTETGWMTLLAEPSDSFIPRSTLQDKPFLISDLYLDRSGIMWIGTDGNGILRSDHQRKQFRVYRHNPEDPHSIPTNFVKSVLEDDQGDLWIGTLEGGLSHLDAKRNEWKHYAHHPAERQSLPSNDVRALHQDEDGVLWVGTQAGLARLERHSRRFVTFKVPAGDQADNVINSIAEFSQDTLVVGTRNRPWLFVCSAGIFMPLVGSRGDTIYGSTWTLLKDRSDGLWLGTYGAGVGRFSLRQRTYEWYDAGPQGLSNHSVRAIFEDSSGILWFGTEDGLDRFDRKTGRLSSFNVEHGLPNSFIYAILPDDKGNLWISTNKGLSRFNPATQTFRNYGTEDGLQSTEFNTGAYFRSKRGELFFGGVNGLNSFFPDSIRDNPHAPTVVLTGFKMFDVPADMGIAPSEISELRLRHDENIFSFEFAALQYTNPARNQYAYMMEGFERDWTYCGTRREVRYTNLPEGKYRFLVKAANSDGVWGTQAMSVSVFIVPPFWKTWWFIVAVALVALGSSGGTIRYLEMRKLKRQIERLEQERALERERTRISKDMHDDVGANLTKIAIMSELALKSVDTAGVTEQLEKISGTARDVVDNISQIVWALNPTNNKLDNLIGYVREHALEFFDGSGVHCHVDFPGESDDVSMSAEVRRNVFLVFKESLNNVLKHSGATEVTLSMTQSANTIIFHVQDNGRGFDPSSPSPFRNGMVNMKRRMDEIGGKLNIISERGKGTRVEIVVLLDGGHD